MHQQKDRGLAAVAVQAAVPLISVQGVVAVVTQVASEEAALLTPGALAMAPALGSSPAVVVAAAMPDRCTAAAAVPNRLRN